MRELFVIYLQNSLQISVIVLLMLLISPVLGRRYSARCRYYVWVVVFVALVLPIRGYLKLNLPQFLQAMIPQNQRQVLPSAVVAGTVAKGGWFQHAQLLWAVGVAVFILWHVVAHLRFLSAVKRWSDKVKDPELLKVFEYTKARLNIKKEVQVKRCACIKTPMVVGLVRPVVLLPPESFSLDELRPILKHELVHIKRKDLWYKVMMLLALAVHWFNPFVHFAVKEALNLCEISCDEEVLQGFGTKARAQYGESIIGTIRNRNAYKTALSTNFYSGARGMKKRIHAMMDLRKKRFSPVLFLVVFAITMCGTTAFALSPAPTVIDTTKDRQQSQAGVAGMISSSSIAIAPTASLNTEQDIPKSQGVDESSLLPNELIADEQSPQVVVPQEQTYGPEFYQLVPGDNWDN